jgi:hypothetical protein
MAEGGDSAENAGEAHTIEHGIEAVKHSYAIGHEVLVKTDGRCHDLAIFSKTLTQ